jgi:hypothetical protein
MVWDSRKGVGTTWGRVKFDKDICIHATWVMMSLKKVRLLSTFLKSLDEAHSFNVQVHIFGFSVSDQRRYSYNYIRLLTSTVAVHSTRVEETNWLNSNSRMHKPAQYAKRALGFDNKINYL